MLWIHLYNTVKTTCGHTNNSSRVWTPRDGWSKSHLSTTTCLGETTRDIMIWLFPAGFWARASSRRVVTVLRNNIASTNAPIISFIIHSSVYKRGKYWTCDFNGFYATSGFFILSIYQQCIRVSYINISTDLLRW